ncbi:Peptidase m35 deuterolysin [Lasiodiplodia theobromae]|uniref:Neutral protease 2 n=1 Tax=Lasiodiplodia theobromae TaxID=45133 RepID=A0A5N5DJI0_9PEZI|nr:Peptidase m35 deuterolysin [Lasiodiplodia theobromae]KAB2577730.1 putative neutral protease 2-like protein A [Lasiodiplodia theobromae]KAF4538408.1 Peptidase m35 deuterolysin [Lasiodiplodia theobromae]
MRFLSNLCLLAFAALAVCASLDAELTSVGGSAMEVKLTNTGSCAVNLFNKGTLLGDVPTQKIVMTSDGILLPFEGVRFAAPRPGNYSADYFSHLPVGESLTVRFDAAEEYDLGAGGNFTAVALGFIPYAEGYSTLLNGSTVAYHSNDVQVELQQALANSTKTARSRFISGVDVKDSCEGDLLTRVEAAIIGDGGCTEQADKAADDAGSDEASDLFKQFFNTEDQVFKDRVSERLRAIADECETIEQGPVKFHCEDVLGFCKIDNGEWSAAYAFDAYHIVCLCDVAFDLPSLTQTCHDLDLTGVMIHELSHLSRVFSPDTHDYATEWPNAANLPADMATENADTYRLYAQAVYLGCPVEDEAANDNEESTTNDNDKSK